MRRLLLSAAAVLTLAGCGGNDSSNQALTSSTSASTPTITSGLGSDFDAKAARLQADIEAVVECVQEDDPACVNDKRDELKFAIGDLRDEVNAIVDENSGACQSRLQDVNAYLAALDTAGQVIFAAAAAGKAQALQPFVSQAEQMKQDDLDILKRVHEACS
jgi:sirohydrochlorin ferrochelatase